MKWYSFLHVVYSAICEKVQSQEPFVKIICGLNNNFKCNEIKTKCVLLKLSRIKDADFMYITTYILTVRPPCVFGV